MRYWTKVDNDSVTTKLIQVHYKVYILHQDCCTAKQQYEQSLK